MAVRSGIERGGQGSVQLRPLPVAGATGSVRAGAALVRLMGALAESIIGSQLGPDPEHVVNRRAGGRC